MLNVLQVIPTLDRSGAEKQMVMLATGLPRERFRVEVAALTRLGPLEADLRAAGVPVTLIGKTGKLDPRTLGRLTRLMKQRKIHVVQTWIFAANVYGRIAARRARVPVVVTAEMAVDLWKSRAELAVDRFLARWTDRVVGNSKAVVEFYRKAGVPEGKLGVIHSGIGEEEPPGDDPEAVRQALGARPGAAVMLFVGRLAKQKGVRDLLMAVDIVQHVEPEATTWVVGDGPLRESLEEVAESFGLLGTGRVRFLGHRDDVPRLLKAADLLVLPSLYEGLPNVVLEAMRFRKPVVATQAPGTTEVVTDGETGVLVPVGAPKELARALRDLIRDPERRKALGEGGRRRVEAEFQAERMIERFGELYEELAREKGV